MDILNTVMGYQAEAGNFIQKYQILLTVLIIPALFAIPKLFVWLNGHCKNLLFITIVIDEADNMAGGIGYRNFSSWVLPRRIEWLSRTYEIISSVNWVNGRRHSDKYSLTAGSGRQLFKFKGGWFSLITTRRESKGQFAAMLGNITITTTRWNRRLLEDLVAEAFETCEEFVPSILDAGSATPIPPFYKNQKQLVSTESYNAMKEVFDRFVGKSEDYFKLEKAHKESVILYGPPGTGKTNIVRHFAALYDMDIVVIKPGSFSKEELRGGRCDAMVHNGIIYLIEDIDSNPNFCRDPHGKLSDKMEEEHEFTGEMIMVDRGDRGSLSELINGLDGIRPLNGAIVIMSTNFPEKLHDSIYREGRVDAHIALEYLTAEDTNAYLNWDRVDDRYTVLNNSELVGKIPAAGIVRLKQCKTAEDVTKSLKQTKLVKSLKQYKAA